MSSLSGFAVLDVPVTPRVRVRRWHHRFGPTDFPAGTHAFIEVAWVLEGRAIYRVGDREIVVERGQGIVIPARLEHATRIEPGTRASSAWLACELVSSVAASLGRRVFADATLMADARDLEQLGALLTAEAAEAQAGQLLAVDSLAEALVVAVVRRAPCVSSAPRDPRLTSALALIDAHYAEALTVDDLARAAGLSRFHFSRMFRDALGMSPYQYLQRIRLERARELLASGHPVTEAALSVGYRDLGRFAKAFREHFGCAPSQASGDAARARSA
jgi:AraC-like DNA-binding protein